MEINLDNYALISLDKLKDYKDLIQKDKIEIIGVREVRGAFEAVSE